MPKFSKNFSCTHQSDIIVKVFFGRQAIKDKDYVTRKKRIR